MKREQFPNCTFPLAGYTVPGNTAPTDLLITVPLFHLVLLYMSIDFGNGKVSVSARGGCWNLRYNFISILDINEDVSWVNPLPEFARKRLQIVSSIFI